MSDLLDRLCAVYGVLLQYSDIWGNSHATATPSKRALLAAMGVAWLGVRWRDLRGPWRVAVLLLSVLTVGMLAREAYRTHVWTRRDAARDGLVRVASWARANT